MQGSTVNRSSNHVSQRRRVIVVVSLLCELLLDEIRVKRTGRSWAKRGYMTAGSRRLSGGIHGSDDSREDD